MKDISSDWSHENEGADSWSPYDVLGHLIHGEKTDWIERSCRILGYRESNKFKPFDRFAQFEDSKGKTLNELLVEFERLRAKNIIELNSLKISDEKLHLNGVHPEFGTVNLRQLLATWVVHDLGHISQISRVMAHQYKTEVGPWKAYLRILND